VVLDHHHDKSGRQDKGGAKPDSRGRGLAKHEISQRESAQYGRVFERGEDRRRDAACGVVEAELPGAANKTDPRHPGNRGTRTGILAMLPSSAASQARCAAIIAIMVRTPVTESTH
jgi:hypothetical protein